MVYYLFSPVRLWCTMYNLEVLDMKDENYKLYDMFLTCSYWDLMKLFKESKTKEEQDFYIMLSNIVLQREQSKVIGK